ncbi:hypothetical protein IIB51_02005 [Patescibacteria group bacterium]|nr:hypothetical protein [Patescibacteria group bacterium]
MENTALLAQFLGLFSVILALSMLIRRKMVVHIMKGVLKNRATTYLIGMLEVIGGLLLVLNHAVWDSALTTAISVLGWLLLIEGVFYLFATQKFIKSIVKILDNYKAYYISSLLYFIFGVYLVYAGFSL